MPRCLLVATMLIGFAARAHAQNAEPALNQLLAQVKQGKNRAAAIANIAKLEPAVAVPALIGLLAKPSEEIRLHAAPALGGIGKPAVGPLQKSLGDADETVRFNAVWALALTGPAAKLATPALIAALRDEDEDVRYKAAYALGQVAADSDDAIAALVRALKDTDADVVAEAKAALVKCGARAVAPLRKALTQRGIAYHATDVLSQLAHAKDDALAHAAADAIPEILVVFNGVATEDELAFMMLLPTFGPKLLPAFRATMKEKSSRARWRIAHVIGQITLDAELGGDDAAARQAIKMLVTLLADTSLDVRLAACTHLNRVAANAELCRTAHSKQRCWTIGLSWPVRRTRVC